MLRWLIRKAMMVDAIGAVATIKLLEAIGDATSEPSKPQPKPLPEPVEDPRFAAGRVVLDQRSKAVIANAEAVGLEPIIDNERGRVLFRRGGGESYAYSNADIARIADLYKIKID